MGQSPSHVLAQIDPILAEVIPQVVLEAWESTEDVYADVACCIVEQQIPYRARGVYLNKLLDLLGEGALIPEEVLKIEEEAWRNRKLSGPKYKALMGFSRHWIAHQMDQIDWKGWDDETVFKSLTQIKGVGPQAAHMVLLYTLRRPDIFPENDFHLKRTMAKLYELPTNSKLPLAMRNIAEAWRPHRSLAVRYLLAWKRK